MKFAVGLLFIAYFSLSYDTASASGICSLSGGGHYYTFDGNKFDYQGFCKAQLASNCLGTNDFNVSVNYEIRNGVSTVSYVSYLTIEFGPVAGRVEVIIGHYPTSTDPVSVRINNAVVTLPQTGTGYTITSVSGTCDSDIILDAPAYGFQVRYNEWAAMLTVEDTFQSSMCGMCGNFNGNLNDDLTDGSFDASSGLNRGRTWGNHWVYDTNCLTATPTPDDVPSCTDNSYACNVTCDYLANSDGIYSAAVLAIGSSLTTYYKADCQIDACISSGQSVRKSVRQFLTFARLKYPGCTGCSISAAGFPYNYADVYCNDNRCDCSSSPKSCQLHIPLCGYWCDCIGRTSGYGTLYECWSTAVANRCYPVNQVDADNCTSQSGTSGSNPYPFTLG